MFRFESPIYLWLLLLIPVMALIRFWYIRNRKRRLKRFGDPTLVEDLMQGVSKYRPMVKFWLLQAALALLVFMLARPQWGENDNTVRKQGIETMICMDVSNSMYATDVVPSRLEKSKMMVENMVDKFNEDKVGLIVYAGDAFDLFACRDDVVGLHQLQDITDTLCWRLDVQVHVEISRIDDSQIGEYTLY